MEVPSYEFDQLIENNARKKYCCPMCQEIIIYAYKTSCNHRFCKYCISKWTMYFKDCPVCRQKIGKVAPHPRTDKWIQQLFDMATPEYRQDREMCINYRKLQQVKLELIGSEALSPKNLNHDKLIEEFAIQQGDDNDNKDQAVLKDCNTNTKKPNEAPPPRWRLQTAMKKALLHEHSMTEDKASPLVMSELRKADDEFRPLYVKQDFHERSRPPSSPQVSQFFEKPKEFVNDVTLLLGAESATQFSQTFGLGKGFNLHRARTFSDLSSNSSVKTDMASTVTNDDFPQGVNSAHTYAVHFKETDPESKVLTLTELTYHDDPTCPEGISNEVTTSTKECSETAKGRADGDLLSHDLVISEATGAEPSEITTTMNMLKADTIRARIQHEIAMASLPTHQGIRHTASAMSTAKKIATQKDKQDLQSCREALLNLRLRLKPPAKRVPFDSKEKHTFSDAVKINHQTVGDWKSSSASIMFPKSSSYDVKIQSKQKDSEGHQLLISEDNRNERTSCN